MFLNWLIDSSRSVRVHLDSETGKIARMATKMDRINVAFHRKPLLHGVRGGVTNSAVYIHSESVPLFIDQEI